MANLSRNLSIPLLIGPTPKVLTAGRGRLLRLVTSHAGDFAETDIKLPPCPHARRDDCYLVTADSVKQHIYVAIRHGQEIFRQTYGKAGKMDKVRMTLFLSMLRIIDCNVILCVNNKLSVSDVQVAGFL